MKRTSWNGWISVILLALLAPLAVAGGEAPPAATAPVRLVAVTPVETPAGTALEVRLSGPFTYTSYQPDGNSLVVDLAGVVSESVAPARAPEISWVSHYRLLPFRNAAGRQVLRLDMTLSQECEVAVTQATASTLSLTCDAAAQGNPIVSSASSEPVRKQKRVFREASAGPVMVQRVRVNETRNGDLVVEISSNGQLGFETLELEHPPRLVVDLPGGILRGRARQLAVESPWVSQVRVAQFKAKPPVTRVVLDLKKKVPFRVEQTSKGLRVVLADSSAQAVASQEPTKTKKTVETARTAANPVAALPTESFEVKQDTEQPVQVFEPVQVASLAPMVPANLLTPVLNSATASPVPVAKAASAEASVKRSEPVAEAATDITQAPPTPVPGASSTNFQVPATAAPETNEFTGDPISVNLQDVDLKDFFRLIHEISGLNIVVDQSVSGTVTLVLIDVPWDQALDIVLKNNGLDHSLDGNVLRIATRATLKRESEEERDLAVARAEAVDPVTVTKQLNYARAQDVEATLQRFLSSRGVLIRDDRTNTLIIQDIPSVIPALEDLIKQLDRKSQQVEIVARVVTARRNFLREFGTQLGFSSGTRNRKQLWGGGLRGTDDTGFIDRAAPLPPVVTDSGDGLIDTAGQVPLATRLGANAATSGLFYNFASANFALDLILTAAENRGIAKVISRPRIITQNNVAGFVKQGAKIPVQTEINNTISTQFIDAVLELRVTPQVTGDGNVFLNIAIKNDRPDFGNAVNGVPSIVTQEATTQVLVNDGGTVVIGGVMVTDNATTIDQVPYLGSIPIIGHLFKRTSIRTSTEELLFFITPRILPD